MSGGGSKRDCSEGSTLGEPEKNRMCQEAERDQQGKTTPWDTPGQDVCRPMKRPFEDFGGKEHSKRVLVGNCTTPLKKLNEYVVTRMHSSQMSSMLTNGTVAFEKDCGDIILEGSSHTKTSQYDQNKAHASLRRLTRTPGFMKNLLDHLLRGDAATFDLDSEGNVETNIQGYEHVSRQAPLPVCRTITISRDAPGHFASCI